MIFKKKLCFLTILSLATLAIVACSVNFNEHYDRVETSKIRPISYQFNKLLSNEEGSWQITNIAETAPGDTVLLEVFFAGDGEISRENIKFSACWNIYTDLYGNLAPRGEPKPFTPIISKIEPDMGGKIVRAVFKIPDDILENSDAIPNDLSGFLETYQIGDGIPYNLKTKTDALNFLKNFSENELFRSQIPAENIIKIDGLAQIFSCIYEIYLEIPGIPRTKIRHTARYHGRLWPVYVRKNYNPVLSYLSFYQGNHKLYDDIKKFSLSGNKNTYVIIGISEGWYGTDKFYTLKEAFSPNPELTTEKYSLRVFYSDNLYGKIELEDGIFLSILDFPAGGYSQNIIIHRDKLKVGDKGWIWIMVYDECYGVSNFPQGRSIVGVPIEFVE
ncbi:MAG: hypothetical protein FWF51_03915 [Chitinivibrionia bacterium]|nr:hypothetical protein [Chitinivibrionia bacterium]